MSVSCDRRVLSGRGLCDGPIARSEESYTDVVCLTEIEEPHRGRLGPLRLPHHEIKKHLL